MNEIIQFYTSLPTYKVKWDVVSNALLREFNLESQSANTKYETLEATPLQFMRLFNINLL